VLLLLTGPRLTLVATTLPHLDAELSGDPAALGRLLQADVPSSWPPGEYDRAALEFFQAQLAAGDPAAVGWYGWYALVRAGHPTAALVGAGGFFGPPDAAGAVEFGYSVAPEHQRQGYATELVRCLVAHARSTPSVLTIEAQTSPANVASVRVLAHAGFVAAGAGREPGQVRYVHAGPAT
jgi:RimJ/RimL family protein N-acetyltransferase